jgi:transcriptional regulator with XRE-family HTH domain
MLIGQYIKNLRKSKKLTLKQLDSLSGVSFSQIGKIERGTTNPSLTSLNKLAKGLDIDNNELLLLSGHYSVEDLNIDPLLRFEILTRDKFLCQLCGASPPSSKIEVNYITPISLGGSAQKNNLVTLCVTCGNSRDMFIKKYGLTQDFLNKNSQQFKTRLNK